MIILIRSWTAPDLSLVERVILIIFDLLEIEGWNLISDYTG